MSDIASAPLPALIRYYERLQADPDRKKEIAEFGFCPQEISFCVILEVNGSLHGIDDLRTTSLRSKKDELRGPRLIVPFNGERSSNIQPNFLWDNTGYVFGQSGKKDGKRDQSTFEAFVAFHEEMLAKIPTDAMRSVVTFLKNWRPTQATTLPNWDELNGKNIAFKIRAASKYVHQEAEVRNVWPNVYRDSLETENRRSLINGKLQNVVSKHEPSIKGAGGQSSGTKIVSFNETSYLSFGKGQSFNAPVGIDDAFHYTTALNRLLADNDRRIRIGDDTVVFWTDRENATEAEGILAVFFDDSVRSDNSAESIKLVHRLKAFLNAAKQGHLRNEIEESEAPFYILGLSPISPNASRLNVRFWMAGTVEQFAKRLARHLSDLEIAEWYSDECDASIDGDLRESSNKEQRENLQRLRTYIDSRLDRQSELISIRDILDETVPTKNNKPDRSRINPRLAGEVSRSILSGINLPRALWSAVLDRVLTEGLVDPEERIDWRRAQHRRMAILKACLNQSLRTTSISEAAFVDTYLDKTHPSVPYQCGRLMAVLSFSQERSLGKVNASVVRRYLSGVVAAPGAMLGRLQVHAEVSHIPKLKGHLPSIVRDELKQINCAIGPKIPLTFMQGDQSYFVLGFYQQLARLDTMRSTQRRLYRTRLGEWVLSKGELNTANALAKSGVHYVYEPRAVLKTGQDRIPDFWIPGDNRSDDVYIEYMGMDTPEYTRRWTQKLTEYAIAGITPEGDEQGRLVIIDDPKSVLTELEIISFLKEQRVIFLTEPEPRSA